MNFTKTTLKDAYLITPQVFADARGFFMEAYSEKKFREAGIEIIFVQDNHSLSTEKGVLRGLHFQKPPYAQAKLVRVTRGKVYDVIVDLRKNSETFGQWEGFELSAENKKMLLVPRGFAHGFLTLEDNTEFLYKCDELYHPESDSGITWNDPTLKIDWPIYPHTNSEDDLILTTNNTKIGGGVKSPILSDKDAALGFFKDLTSPF